MTGSYSSRAVRVAVLASLTTLLLTAPPTFAQTLLYWDADGDGSSATGGTGTWIDNGTGFRNGSSTGTITGLNNNTSAIAVFEGTPGTVTVVATNPDPDPIVGGISSNSSSYTLALGDNTLTINSGFNATYRGNITGTGGITKSGSGTQTLANSISYSGDTVINGGTLQVAGFDMTSSDFVLADTSGVNLVVPGNLFGTYGNQFNTVKIGSLSGGGSNGGNVTVGNFMGLAIDTDETSTFAGNITGNGLLSKAGSATQTFTGTVTGHNFTVSANSGEVVFGAGGTTGSLNAASSITVASNSTLAFNRSDAISLSNNITSSGTFEQRGSGTLTLTGGVTVDNLNIAAGTVSIGNGGTAGTVSSDITNSSALIFNRSDDLSVAGDISGTGTLNKQGAGVLTLSGNNTYSGGTTVEGGTLRVSGGNAIGNTSWVFLNDTAGVTLDLNGSNETIWSLAGGGSNGGNVTLGSGTLTTGSQPTDTTFSGVISGTGGLVKVAGQNNFTLAGANTYTGSTTVNGGNLVISADNNLGAAPASATPGHLTLNGGALKTTATFTLNANRGIELGANDGTFDVGSSTTLTAGGTISGAGDFFKTGDGTLILAGTNTYSGATTLNSGLLQLANGDAIPDNSAVSLPTTPFSDLELTNADETIGSLTGGAVTGGYVVLNSNTLTTGGDNSDTTYSGVFTGTGGLVKTGTGTFTLDANNTFSGGTTLAGGTLSLGSAGAIGSTGTLSFTGGELEFSGSNTTDYSSRFSTADNQAINLDTNGQDITLDTALTSSGASLTKSGSGTLFIRADNTYDGPTVINAGTLSVGEGNSTGSLTGNISGAGALTKVGVGTLTLSGTNTYTGPTTISAGNLTANGGNAIGDSNAVTLADFSGAVLTLGASETIGSLAGGGSTGGNVTLGSHRLTHGGDDSSTTFSGVLSGTTGGVTKEGTGTFIMNNSSVNYDGDTIINAGTLQANAAAIPWGSDLVLANTAGAQFVVNFTGSAEQFAGLSGGGTNGGNIVINSGGILQPGFNDATSTYAGAISGAGQVNKVGAGTLTLTGTSSFTGNLSVSGGSLVVGNGATSGGGFSVPISVASGANLTFDRSDVASYSQPISGEGSLTQAGSGTIQLNGSNSYTGGTFLNDGVVLLTNANSISTEGTFTFNGGWLQSTGSNTTDYSSRFSNAANQAYNIDTGAQNITLASDLSSSGGTFHKAGSGTATLSGTNTFDGQTSISAGNLILSGGNALSDSSAVVLSDVAGATLTLGASETIGSLAGGGGTGGLVELDVHTLTLGADNSNTTFSGLIQSNASGNPGGVTKTGTGTFIMNNAGVNYNGDTTILGGTLQANAPAIPWTSDLVLADTAGAQFVVNFTGSAEQFAGLSGGGANGGNISIIENGILQPGFNDATSTYDGVISGDGALNKVGSGTLTLTGANTHTGGTTVSGGTLRITGTNGLFGDVTAAGGTLQVSGGNALPDTTTVSLADSVGSIFDLDDSSETILAITGGGTTGGTVDLGSGTLTVGGTDPIAYFSGAISGTGGLTKTGTGSLSLLGSNTYSGETTVNGGLLALGGGNALADTAAVTLANISGAEISIINSETIGSLAGGGGSGGIVYLNSQTLTTGGNNDSTTFAGFIDGGALTKTGTGTFILTRNNTLTGTTISDGTLQLGNGGTSGSVSGSIVNNAALVVDRSNGISLGSISGSGSLTHSGTGTLTVTSVPSYTGTTTLNGGGLVIDNSVSGTLSSDISGSGSLTKSGSGTLTLSGNNTYSGPTTLHAGLLRVSGGNGIGDSSAVTLPNVSFADLELLNANETIGSLAGGGLGGGYVVLNSFTLTTGGDDSDTTYAGVLTGTGGLTKNGTGTLTLGSSNTFTGTTTVNGGTVTLGHATNTLADTSDISIAGGTLALGSNSDTVDAVTLSSGSITGSGTLTGSAFNFIDSGTVSGNLGGSAALTKSGPGTLTLTGNNTFTGATTISDGTLQLGDGGTSGSVAGDIINNAALAIDRSAAISLSNISGSGSLTKSGSGTLTLSGNNTYSGTTTINAGGLGLSGGSALSDTSVVTLDDVAGGQLTLNASETIGSLAGGGTTGGNVNLNAHTLTTGGNHDSTTFAGIISGSGGALTKTGTGTFVLTANNTFTGATTISNGTLQLGNGGTTGTLAGAIVNNAALTIDRSNAVALGSISGSGSLTNSGSSTLTLGGTPSYTGTITLGGGDLIVDSEGIGSLSGDISGGADFTKTGSGTLTLGGNNTYSGSTTVNLGLLRVANGNGIADSSAVTLPNIAGADLELHNANETIGSLAGGGSSGGYVVLNSFTLTTGGNDSDTSYAGVITGTGALTKTGTGTFTLTGDNTFTGTTTISDGTLQLGDGGTTGIVVGDIVNNTALAIDRSNAISLGDISGSGSLTKSGSGTLTLGGNNTYSGDTNVLAGLLRVANGNGIGDSSAVTLPNVSFADLELQNADETIGSLAGGGLNGGYVVLNDFTLTTGVNNTDTTYSGVLTGTGNLVKTGTGTLTLDGDNTFTGTTTVNGGTLTLGRATDTLANTSDISVVGGTLALGANSDTVDVVTLSSGSITGSGTLTGSAYNLTDSGTISARLGGSAALTKSGGGTATLSGPNIYTGGTNINAGTLALGHATDTLPDVGAVTIAGGTLALGANSDIVGTVNLSSGSITGSGTLTGSAYNLTDTGIISAHLGGSAALTKSGGGTATLSGSNTYTGGTNINAGTLALGHATDTLLDLGTVTIAGGTLALGANSDTVGTVNFSSGSITGSGTLTGSTYNLTDSGTISASLGGSVALTKSGAGTATLSGSNAYTGGTTINAGTLSLGHATDTLPDAGTVSIAGGTLALGANSDTVGTVNLSTGSITGSGTLSGSTFNFTDTGTISANLGGSSALTKSGPGTTTIDGTLNLGGNLGTNGTHGTEAVPTYDEFFTVIDAGTGTHGTAGGSGGNAGSVVVNAGTLSFDASNLGLAGGAGGSGGNGGGPGPEFGTPGNGGDGGAGGNAGSVTLNGGTIVLGATSGINLAGGSGGTGGDAGDAGGGSSSEGSGGAGGTGGSLTLDGGDLTLNSGTISLAGGNGGDIGSGTMTATLGNAGHAGNLSVSDGTFTMNGGALILTGGTTTDEFVATAGNGGNINLTGGTFAWNAGTIDLRSGSSNETASDGAFNLNGGELVGTSAHLDNASSFHGDFNFNSGTLRLTDSTVTYSEGSGIFQEAFAQEGAPAELGNRNLIIDNTLAIGADFTVTHPGTLSADTIHVTGGAFKVSAANAVSTNTELILANAGGASMEIDANQTFASLSGGGATGGAVTLTSGTLTIGDTTSTTYGGAISGTGALTKVGSGTLTLTGTNSHSGSVTIGDGVLQLGNGGSTGSLLGDITNNAQLIINRSDNLTMSNTISGSGFLTKQGGGILTVSDTSHSGPTDVEAGTLRATGNGLSADSTYEVFNGAILDIATGTAQIAGLRGTGTVDLNSNLLNIGKTGVTTSFDGTLSGDGQISVNNGGQFVISGAQTLTGTIGTFGTNSVLSLDNDASFAANNNFDIGDNSFFSVDRSTDLTLAGDFVLRDSAKLDKMGTGTLTLSGSNSRTESGIIDVDAGTLRTIGSSGGMFQNASVEIESGATLDLADTDQSFASFNTLSGSAITLGSGQLTVTGDADSVIAGTLSGTNGSLVKQGTGTLTLSGDATQTGGTTVSSGSLQIGDGGTSGTIAGNIVNNASLVFNRSNTSTFAGNSSGSGSFTKTGSGTLIVTGSNTHSGGTTIAGGTLQFGNGGSTGFVGGNITNNGNLAVNRSDDLTLSSTISGTGSFTKLGANALTLSGNNTYSGGTTLNAGTLNLGHANAIGTGSLTLSGGTLDNTSGSGITLSGNNAQNWNGDFTFTGTDDLNLGTGALNISGARTINVAAGTLTANGNGSLGGNFTKTGSGTLALGGDLNVSFYNITVGGGTLRTSGTHTGNSSLFPITHTVTGTGSNNATMTVSGGSLAVDSIIVGATGDGASNSTITTTAGESGILNVTGGTVDLRNYPSVDRIYVGNGALNQSGGTINAGLDIGVSGGTGTAHLSGGTFNTVTGINNSTTVATTLGSGGHGTLTLSDTGTLNTTGTLTLGDNASDTGTLNFGDGGSVGTLNGVSSIATGSGSGSVNFNHTGNFSLATPISGNLTVTKSGTGTTTLSGTNTYTGGTNLNAGTLSLGSAGALGSSGDITFGGGTLQFTSSNTTDYSGRIRSAANQSINLDLNSQSITFASDIPGPASDLILSGNGSLTITGTNSEFGATITSGSLHLGAGGTTGSLDGSIVNNGTLVINRSDDLTMNNVISGTGTFSQSGTNTLTVSDIDISGATEVQSGTLSATNNGLAANSTYEVFSGATLDVATGSGRIAGLKGSGTVDLNNNLLNIGKSGINTIFDGTLTGSGHVVVSNGGFLVLSGAQTLTGTIGTFDANSVLVLDDDVSFAASNNFDIGENTFLSVERSNDLTLAGNFALKDSATLNKLGTGTLTLSGSNSRTEAGIIDIDAGTLRTSGSSGGMLQNASVTIESGATLDLADTNQAFASFNALPGSAITLGSGQLTTTANANSTIEGTLSGTGGSLVKQGTGTLTLADNNTFTGGTTVSAGTLQIGSGGTTGSLVGDITNNGNVTFNRSDNQTFAGNISGTGTLTKQADNVLTLSGTNTYAGDTFVNDGTLRMGSANALSPNTTLRVAPGATFNPNGFAQTVANLGGTGDIDVGTGGLNVNPTGTNTFTGRLIGNGGLTKGGTGTLELTGTHTFSGPTAINAGRIRLTGSAANSAFAINNGGTLSGTGTVGSLTVNTGGILSPGNSPGTLNAGDTVWAGDASFILELDNATGAAGTNWDLLNISGTLTINATMLNPFTINVDTLLNGTDTAGAMDNFDANTNYTWTFAQTSGGINYGTNASVGASFAINTDDFANTTNGTFSVAQIGNNLALTYSAVPEPGSFGLILGTLALGFGFARRRRVRRSS